MKDQPQNKTAKNFFYRVLCGAFIGLSIIAPGISGSIMTVMMGIYDDLITIISNPFKNFKKNVIYIFPLGLGAALSVVVFIKALDWLFKYYPTPAYLLFISLIAGSIPTVIKEAKIGKIKKRYFIGVICAFAFALSIGILAKHEFAFAINTADPTALAMRIYMPVCGLIAGMMSMIPGMSISMVLMMFKIYEPLLDTAASFNIPMILQIVAPVAICFVIGMVLFSNVTKMVFNKFRSLAYLMVLGFMSGSIVSIFPQPPKDLMNWLLSVIAVFIGIAVYFIFKKLGDKYNVE